MTNAYRDENSVPTLIGVSSVDGFTPTRAKVDPTTGRLLVDLSAGSGTVTSVSVVTANGISGSVATATTTPAITLTLGAITPTTVNGNTFTTGTYTLTGQAGKTLTFNGSITLTGTDAQTYTFPTTSATLARTDAANTFTGVQTMTSPALTTPAITGLATGNGVASAATASTLMSRDSSSNTFINTLIQGYATTAGAGGTTTLTVTSAPIQFFTGTSAQTLVLPVTSTLSLGYAFYVVNNTNQGITVQSSGANNIVILAANTSATLTCILTSGTTAASWSASYMGDKITSGKSLSVSNSLTLAGTDSTTMTFPTTSATIARNDAANTFTGTQTFSNAVVYTNNAITASGNAATVPVTAKLNTVTNNSAATLTITMTTASAVDGQMTIVRILDFSAVAQTITWVNTENSTVTAPVTSNGSTTLFLTAGFIYNGATSKWRCIASA